MKDDFDWDAFRSQQWDGELPVPRFAVDYVLDRIRRSESRDVVLTALEMGIVKLDYIDGLIDGIIYAIEPPSEAWAAARTAHALTWPPTTGGGAVTIKAGTGAGSGAGGSISISAGTAPLVKNRRKSYRR